MQPHTPRLLALPALASCASPIPSPPTESTPGIAPARQEDTGSAPSDEQALKQANNPLANMTAFNVQNYYVPELSGSDETANMLWFRYAQPISTGFGDWLMRASLPVSTVPTGPQTSESGLGDANVFAAYLFESDDPSLSFGLGPIVGLPTASEDELGTDQWSAGAAAVLFDARSAQFQYGGLVTWQHKIGGSSRAPDVNLLAVQPFAMLQLGGGAYFRSAGIWAFDLEDGDHSVPVGFGLGKVVKSGNTVFNVFIEPQFTVVHEGAGQPEFQLFVGLNTQFLGQ